MLKSIFIDNFRCLENFELKLGRLNLLMGPNGSGKSSVFEVLRRLQRFNTGQWNIKKAFPATDMTRSRKQSTQRFGMEIEVGKSSFKYILLVEHSPDRRECWINEESLTQGGKDLYCFKGGKVLLKSIRGRITATYPFDPSLSAMAGIPESKETRDIQVFRRELGRFIIAGLSPAFMEPDSGGEVAWLSPQMENFVSWYRRVFQRNVEHLSSFMTELKPVLPGFRTFNYEDAGSRKVLNLYFVHPKKPEVTLPYEFSRLSDGQRVLFALYALVFGARGEKLSLFLDEPDNYVSLREIQPWLSALGDEAGIAFEQAVIASHHPEIIDYMGASQGRFLWRVEGGAARVSEEAPDTGGLTLSETIARGWDKK